MKTARRHERGFALLLVFAMAAAVAVLLYTEMPRIAFEAQRGREQLLIDRGEQYQRAIQLFVRKNQRFPARIEDLENTNNIRYLRRRYPDPMTGKDEWRLIHVGPGGVLLDSKVQKQPSPDAEKEKQKKAENLFVTESLPVGSTLMTAPGQQGAGATAAAALRRASDRAPVSSSSAPWLQTGGAPQDPNEPQQAQPMAGVYPVAVAGQPGVYPAGFPPPGDPANPQSQVQPGMVWPNPGQPGQPTSQQSPYPGFPTTPPPAPGQPGYPSGQPGAYPGMNPQGQFVGVGQPGLQPGQYPNPPASSQTGGQVPTPFSAYQQQQQPMTGAQAAGANPALDLIRNLLTTPRQGGMIGTASAGGTQIGGGIAGVASKMELEGIKVYNEKTAYHEWEFIYDMKNDRSLGAGVGMGAGAIQGMPGQMGTASQQSGMGQSGFGQSGFGQSGFGQSGFGQPGFGQSGFGQQRGTGMGTTPVMQQPGMATQPGRGR